MAITKRPYPCKQKETYREENLERNIQYLFVSQNILVEMEKFRAEREKL